MNLSRRSFLRGALAVTAVAVTNLPALASVPKIVGDGVHDDTDGLQALFDGKPFMVENETIIARSGYLRGGKYLVSRTLEITGSNIRVENAHFIRTEWDTPLISARDTVNSHFHFSVEGSRSGTTFKQKVLGRPRFTTKAD